MSALVHFRRTASGMFLAVLCALMAWSCSSDSPTDSGSSDDGVTKIDTSHLTVVQLTHTAYDEDGSVHTGLTIQWKLRFESTTGRDCRIRSYTLRNQHGQDVFSRLEPSPGYISAGDELTDKTTWVPIDGESSAGVYIFSIVYETGQVYVDADEHRRWVGPLSNGTVTETFEAVPINRP